MDAELRDLRLFLALAKDPHFSRVAASCGVSQPALTRSLVRLERAIGVRLVDRKNRGVTSDRDGFNASIDPITQRRRFPSGTGTGLTKTRSMRWHLSGGRDEGRPRVRSRPSWSVD
jgi:hypothetical protein